ncbi:hypothetical protein EKO27_g12014 [Xylaria grammica]|uniref:Thioester reductase (TE) domain-containing protein n=1 Tax=Xylaria grammica TaxID=363999 RepID=A0A439CLQ6_9PEZI|nr:hypothetical protein EKO27_g12014 [Xylaria grammica]
MLLTGSTRFLGGAILQRLVRDSSVSGVHCIGVPKTDVFRPTPDLPEYAKVQTYIGSPATPILGLLEAEAEVLSREVDVVIHAGSKRSFLNLYKSLCPQTLGATRYLASLALPRRIAIHFISTDRVVLLTDWLDDRGRNLGLALLPPAGQIGWLDSGKAGVRALFRGSSRAIWAPGTNPSIMLSRRRTLKAVPALEKVEGFIDYAPVGDIADSVFLHVMTSPQLSDEGKIQYKVFFVTKPYERHRATRKLTALFYRASATNKLPELKQHIQKRSQAVLHQVQVGHETNVYSLTDRYALDSITFLVLGPGRRSAGVVVPIAYRLSKHAYVKFIISIQHLAGGRGASFPSGTTVCRESISQRTPSPPLPSKRCIMMGMSTKKPHLFLPKRWLPQDEETWKLGDAQLIPFGYGGRICLGIALAAKVLSK